MSVNRWLLAAAEADELLFTLSDDDHAYTHSDVCDLLEEAVTRGFELDGPELRCLQTVRQLECLLRRKQ